MKKCPYCAEEIQDEAKKCRYCHENLNKKGKWLNCCLGCLLGYAIMIGLIPLFMYLSFFLVKFIMFKLFLLGPSPDHYSPFSGGGIEGMTREFVELFRQMWERLRDFLQTCPMPRTL